MKYIKYAILLTAAVLAFSCVDNPSGLFYSLQYESEIIDGELDNGLTIGDMAMRNAYYFIASGAFRYKAVDGTTWSVSTPIDAAGYSCYKLINLDEIYAIFFHTDTLDYKLFKAVTTAVSTDVITWSEIVIADIPTDERLIDIAQSGGRLFLYTEKTVSVVSGNDKRYSVYSTDATSLAAGTGLVDELDSLDSYGELDVDYDGANYWLISGNKLYSGLSGALVEDTAAAEASALILENGYGGVYCHGTDVYLSTDEGVLLKYTGGAWTDLTGAASLNRIFDIERVTIASESIDVLLLGSEKGYYELDLGAAAPVFTSPETADTKLSTPVQFASIELSNDVIRSFFFDTDNNRIFALGYNAGLWENSLQANGRFWNVE
ncbi:MAG: hypothetical protein JEZ04_02335 [Spirochaetales bacterium]|nr:hypothetical protein [Spirochaetales bacterium]